MTTETMERETKEGAFTRERLRLEHTRKFLKKVSWALAIGFVVVIAALGIIRVESYRISQREAGVFASVSAAAFELGFCDRALRLSVAGLPPAKGSSPVLFRSPQLQGELSFFGSAHSCYFRLALAGHAALVNGASFIPDGSRVVTSSWDRTARVWDVETGTELTTLSGHMFWVNSAAFSPDGSRIVTASWDKTARVWDVKMGAVLAVLSGHMGQVNSAAFRPDGSRITASNDNTARVWDAKTGTSDAKGAGPAYAYPALLTLYR